MFKALFKAGYCNINPLLLLKYGCLS